MLNHFYSLSSIQSSRLGMISFMLVLLLLAQPVAACAGHSNVQIQCENGYENGLFLHSLAELSRFKLPEECEATQQTVEDFESLLPTVAARVAETQWINVTIMVGASVDVPVYELGECYLRETKKVGDVVIMYEHARPYCVGETDFCSKQWSVSYVRKILAEASAGNVGNLSMVLLVAMVGIGFGVKVGQKNHRLGRFFSKKLVYGLLGFVGLYALVVWAAYANSWIGIFEYGFLGPVFILVYGVPQLLQPSSFGEFFLMIAGAMFALVFVAMQIKLSFKQKNPL